MPEQDLQRRELIIDSLTEEPVQTAELLSLLKPNGKNGQELKPFLPKPTARPRPGAYNQTRRVLKNQLRTDAHPEKPLVRFREHASEQYVWALKGYRFPENYYNRRHELACATLYHAYRLAGVLKKWMADPETYKKLRGIPFKLRFDRLSEFTFNPHEFFHELDRGTEDLDVIKAKVTAYLEFWRWLKERNETAWFHVPFYVAATRYGTIEERCEDIINVIADCDTPGYMFLVARFQDAVDLPQDRVFVPVNKPDSFLSLTDLSV